MAAATVWALGEAVQSANVSMVVSVVANTLEYPGIVTVPVAWFLFALYYTGRQKYVTRTALALLFTIPVITVFLVATNPFHYLFYSEISAALIKGTTIWQYSHGPLFLIHIGYTYLLTFLAFLLILVHVFVEFDRYRKQTLILLIAALIPFFFNILYVVQPAGLPRVDITPISFTLMGLLIAWGILRYRMLSVSPGVYSTVVKNIPDGVFVTDLAGEIIDLNKAGEDIIGKPAGWILGKTLLSILPGLGPGWACMDTRDATRKEIEIYRNQKATYYDVLSFPLVSGDQETGCVVTLRDITEQKLAKDALETANRKLNLLSSITRHDINNQLTVLAGYLDVAGAKTRDPDVRNYVECGERAVSTIETQIQFTAQYQDIGVNAPSWQHLGRLFEEALSHFTLGVVTTECTCGNLEVYADPLFEKTFYNLVDNSLRYGGPGLTRIRVHTRTEPEGLVVIYEDNGTGIAGPDKEKIFSRMSGQTGGHGLFLVREILAITRITIRESGEPGSGARFEIRVPKGMYRGTT